ncbi:uncharacterized protein LOC134720797 [Mytilus trossulus]|uniref:uncharacterized protein LOC134720797 n=1 Tax=Mytilus trossulus TaxID=6551 RepID=UPI003006A958
MADMQAVQQAYLLALTEGNQDPALYIQTLIHADCQLALKYMSINMESLIELNSQNVDQLTRITIALSILEKYTRHLLKPEENRSNMWKYVKFSNQIFKDRVDAIQGGRELMKMMGYTKDIKDGLAFPDDGKTDPEVLTQMLADILLGKQELQLFLTGSHPHSQFIDKLLPQNTLIELKRFRNKLQQVDPSSVLDNRPANQVTSVSQVREPSLNQPTIKPDSYLPETRLSTSQYGNSPLSSPTPSSYRTAADQSQQLSRPESSAFSYVTANTGVQEAQSQPQFVVPQSIVTAQQLHNAQPSLGRIDSNQIPIMAKLMAQGKSISLMSHDNESSSPSISTSTSTSKPVSSENSPSVMSEPSVPQAQPSTQLNNDSIVNTSTEESVFPSGSACDICGNRQAEVICEICDNKQLCLDCDDKWHQHPRRQNHRRENIAGEADDHLPNQKPRIISHGETPQVRKVSSHEGRTDMTMPHGGGGDSFVTANYNPPQQTGYYNPPQAMANFNSPQTMANFKNPQSMGAEKRPGMSYLTNRMQNLGVEGHGRARATSAGESGMAEMSNMMEPQSVQTGSWSNQHQVPYGYSHQTNVVGPIQAYGSPMSGSPMSHMQLSSSPSMASGGQQFFNNQQVQMGSQPYFANQQFPRNQLQHQQQMNSSLSQGHQQNQSSTAPGGPPTSRLLPSILAIPDLQRRKSKVDINLMTLREEIEDVETKINELISQNGQFFSDPEYASLYKKKGMLTREKMELEKYERELEQALRGDEQNSFTPRKGSLPDVLSQPVIFPPPYYGGQPSHIQSNQPQIVTQSPGFLVYSLIPQSTITGSISPESQGQPGYSLIPATPQLISAHQNIQYPQIFSNQPRPPDFPGVYQSPPSSQNFVKQQFHATIPPRIDRGQQKTTHQRSFEEKMDNVLPNLNPKPQQMTQDTMQKEERQNQQNTLKLTPPIPHRQILGVNPPHSYVNVPTLSTSIVQSQKKLETVVTNSQDIRTWICSHCTLHNRNNTKICNMCCKTSGKPQYVDASTSVCDTTDKAKDPSIDDENETAVLEIGQKIGEITDQIYNEKIAAQKQYKERVEKENLQAAALKSALPKAKLPDPVPVVTTTVINIKPEVTKPVQSTPKMINRPKESPSKMVVGSPFSAEKFSGSSTGKNFAETLEDIQRRKKQEEMQFEGKKLLMLLKNCEKDGIDAEEVELAVELSGDVPAGKWLREKWIPLVDRVIHSATNQGAMMEQNDVGELSLIESKEALKHTGNEVNAARMCVEYRKKLYSEIEGHGNFAREDILQAMLHTQGDLENSVDELNSKWLQLFYDRIWLTEENVAQLEGENPLVDDQKLAQELAMARANEICNSVTNSVLSYTTFQATVKDRTVDLERRLRLILVEGKLQSWGRAEIVIRILDEEVATKNIEASLEEVVEAVRNCGDRASSLVFLKQYCEICYCQFPMTKIRNLGCNCKLCVHCVKENFEIMIRERHVRNMNCPMCSLPDMENIDEASDYLAFLTLLLQTMVPQDMMELFHSKLRDWHLQKDPNFRWCVHCGNGFIWAVGNQTLMMACPTCKKGTCFNCKKMWEDQHEGLTCEQYAQWKIDNDPENQTAGLARYLEDNGIDCPSCKMKFSLAKGGCMHFKCPQCGFEFCSGCSQPFHQKGVCRKYRSCQGQGLHCHHPRNCLYYLRDEDFDDLQKLLKTNKIHINTTAPDQEAGQSCPVMEQKEDPEGKRDEACGREVEEGFAGLCKIHYKEYLVSLINKRNVDPVAMMSVDAIKRLIEREEKKVPEKKANETDAKYRKRLEQFIREIEPLNRQE